MNKFTPLILILIALAAGFFYVRPQYAKIQAHKAEGAEYDALLVQAQELKDLKAQLEEKRKSFSEDDLARLDKLVPEKVDTARLILDVSGVAAKYAISLEGFKTTEVLPDTRPGEKKELHKATTLSFDFQSSYEAMLAFVRDLEKSLRMVDVVSISIAADDALSPFLNYDITLQAYWLDLENISKADDNN